MSFLFNRQIIISCSWVRCEHCLRTLVINSVKLDLNALKTSVPIRLCKSIFHNFLKNKKKILDYIGRNIDMLSKEWILCPIYGNKTRVRIRKDTELKNFPLYCTKCSRESLIEVKNLKITVIKEPDALDAEPMNQ